MTTGRINQIIKIKELQNAYLGNLFDSPCEADSSEATTDTTGNEL